MAKSCSGSETPRIEDDKAILLKSLNAIKEKTLPQPLGTPLDSVSWQLTKTPKPNVVSIFEILQSGASDLVGHLWVYKN